MKKLKYILLSCLMAFGFSACDTVDFGDINENQNGATEPYTAGLLSSSIMSYATITGRDGLMKPTLFVQYQSQVTYTDEMLYAEVPVSWYTYYVDVLSTLDQLIDYVEDESNHTPALLSQGSPDNQIGVAMIFKAIAMKRVTDTWGDAPYSEAFQGTDNFNPSYDTQESIYKTLISELKAGRDMLNASETAPIGDIIYGGNVNNWKKLANSVILQMALQLSEVDPGYAETEFTTALNHSAGVIDELSEEAWFQYEDIAGFRNPWNANRTPDYFMSKEFTDALKGNAALNPTSNTTYDERILVYADNATLDGVPYGYEDGSGAGAASVSNDYYWNNVTSLPLMTASYVYLNRAEAAALNWTTEDASAMLREGIEMSYESLENLTAEAAELHNDPSLALDLDPTTYVAARLVDAANAPGGILQVIGEEKWVSLFGQGFDAWAEWRRTGYPQLTPATDFFNDGNIPTRYLYPVEEPGLNPAKYQEAVSRLNPAEDKGTAHVWWDVD